ncbi:MFS family permease [Xanthomonas campestris]
MSVVASSRFPPALLALTIGAFGIGTTEFVIMGLLQQVAGDLGVSLSAAGLLISGYALGVFVGAPVLTLASARLPRKAVLVGLMLIFTVGNVACALAPDYTTLMVARMLTSLAHGTFFGVGAVVATSLVLDAIAAETGRSVPQIAINWLLQRPTVSTVLIGARDEAQLRENLGAVGWSLTDAQRARLDAASAVEPPYPYYPYWRGHFAERSPLPV